MVTFGETKAQRTSTKYFKYLGLEVQKPSGQLTYSDTVRMFEDIAEPMDFSVYVNTSPVLLASSKIFNYVDGT